MKLLTVAAFAMLPFALSAQKKVISLPFEFEKSMLAARDYDAYFLDNKSDSLVSLILKDNRKAEYVQLNKNFNIQSKLDLDLNATVFKEDITDYRGGTARGNVFNYVYEEKEKKAFSRQVTIFQLETIDFGAKTVKHSSLFEIPKAETVLSSFSDNNTYYTVTADDKAKELVFYVVNDAGAMKQKRLPFTVPDIAGKKRDKISEYFTNLRVFKSDEEPDLSSAVSSAKLFSRPDNLTLVINEEGHPVHVVTIQIPAFTVKESFIDVSSFKKDNKEKIYVNSFLKGDKLFSLVLNKKSIQVGVHNAATGDLLGKQEINEETNFGAFAQYPVSERRMGKKADSKDVDDIKKLIKALDKGTEGIMVTENDKQQLILTIGTYNLVPMSNGGSGGGWTGGFEQTNMLVTPNASNHGATSTTVLRYNPNMYYRPGTPSYTTTNARYYTTTYFKVLMDPAGTKYAKGKVPVPVPEQIKDYMQEADPKAKATNQFAIGSRQFYGFYDKDSKSYVIEEIRMRK